MVGGLLLMIGTFLNLTGRLALPGHRRGDDFETSFSHPVRAWFVPASVLFAQQYGWHPGISTTLFGLMYVPWLLNFIQKINFFPGVDGHYFLLYFVLITKFSDTGAYSWVRSSANIK